MLLHLLLLPVTRLLSQMEGQKTLLMAFLTLAYCETSTINSIVSQQVDIPAASSSSLSARSGRLSLGDGSMTEGGSGEMACTTGSWPKQLSHSRTSGACLLDTGSLGSLMWLWSQSHEGQGGKGWHSASLLQRRSHGQVQLSCVGGICKNGLHSTGVLQRKCFAVGRLVEVLTFIGDTI